jgi:hypothetical protein
MYQASVPVFRHYLSRVSDIVAVAGPDALDARIADSFFSPPAVCHCGGLCLADHLPAGGTRGAGPAAGWGQGWRWLARCWGR